MRLTPSGRRFWSCKIVKTVSKSDHKTINELAEGYETDKRILTSYCSKKLTAGMVMQNTMYEVNKC